jgi:adenosylcobinamide amidohydrolase
MQVQVDLNAPWLTLDLGQPMRVLSWAVHRPGFVHANHISWREVRNKDLPKDLDPIEWLVSELRTNDMAEHVCFLTSRDVAAFETAEVTVGSVTATCVATVGLSNAEAVGQRLDRRHVDWGTINVACALNTPLSDTGLIEALSIATEARTAAVMDAEFDLPTGRATGTGTDCIALAAANGDRLYAGKHTEIGEAVGGAVRTAVAQGAKVWMDRVRRDAP